jgi:glycosyltransferase involved in cell wall biosynthesis
VRISVISPFVDRQHGTERVLAEQLERLSVNHGCEIILYSQRVDDLAISSDSTPRKVGSGGIHWSRVATIPGPHLLQYLFWFCANTVCRWRDRRFRGLKPDLLFSPGINAFDADAIAVHIVFHEFYRHAVSQLRFRDAPLSAWLRRLHRRLYYKCIMALERRIYRDPNVQLTAVSGLVAEQLREHFGRADVRVIPNGVAVTEFNRADRLRRRERARMELGIDTGEFVLLLLGNDWVKKGLQCLIRSLAIQRDSPTKVIVAGTDDCRLFSAELQRLALRDKVKFERPRDDVMLYYAAADVYVGASLEDAYGLPIVEAMSCGLPVIASVRAGASELIQHGVNGLLLRDPTNERELAMYIGELFIDASLRQRLGEAAEITARDHSWERNAQELMTFLQGAVAHSHASKQKSD